jgi:very-short-patch-repair endonuclease
MKTFEEKVLDMYQKNNKSTYEIAEALKTYPNKVRRALIKNGISLKSKSSAQKNALKNGRSKHPTKGTSRDPSIKLKISSKMVDYWEEMDKKEREKRSEAAKERWSKLSESKKQEMREKANQQIRISSTEGSKLERFFAERLRRVGYTVLVHKKDIIPQEKLEIDLYIPEANAIIEVDGPSHFLPIWGEEKLQKQLNADIRKSGTLLTKGFIVFRIKSLGEESLKKREEMLKIVVDKLEEFKYNKPDKDKRFIEVE